MCTWGNGGQRTFSTLLWFIEVYKENGRTQWRCIIYNCCSLPPWYAFSSICLLGVFWVKVEVLLQFCPYQLAILIDERSPIFNHVVFLKTSILNCKVLEDYIMICCSECYPVTSFPPLLFLEERGWGQGQSCCCPSLYFKIQVCGLVCSFVF